ncbi:MAG: repressor LexA [Gammaproteobacteria bacterium]|nr:MAG: repressor LexA [Gammaproteobacteria bacterium]
MGPTQEKILKRLDRYIRENGESPTLEELGKLVQIKSRGTMHRHVSQLIEEGYLEKSPRHWRGLRVVQQPEDAANTLPFIGRIAAGKPIEAIEGYDEVDLGKMLCQPGRYVLQVVGESMTGMGLLDGDYVVIEQQNHAMNGQVVVALIDNEEATLKRFYSKPNGMVELVAENEGYTPMLYPADRITIQGVLVGQMRVYK